MHIPTRIGIHWLWLVLSWPWDWNTDRWLLNTVVIVIKERNTLRDVIGSCWDAIAVKVWRNKRLHTILWPLHTVLISWPLSQAVWAFPLRQVAHYCVVLWVQQHRVLLWSISNSVFIHMKNGTITQYIMWTQPLTGVSPRTEGTVAAPSNAVQTAAFSVCSSSSLEGLWAHVVPLQTLPANIHVYIFIRL